jgi:hypothetical protein
MALDKFIPCVAMAAKLPSMQGATSKIGLAFSQRHRPINKRAFFLFNHQVIDCV